MYLVRASIQRDSAGNAESLEAVWTELLKPAVILAECQELCKLSQVLASFAGADKNTLCIFLLCYLTK